MMHLLIKGLFVQDPVLSSMADLERWQELVRIEFTDVIPHRHRHLPLMLQHRGRPRSPPSPSHHRRHFDRFSAPPRATIESIGELIIGHDMQVLSVSIGAQMSGLISADEGAGREKLELNSPPPPSASADVELSGEGTRTLSLEEGLGEATGLIVAGESAQRDVEELHVLISTKENEVEEGELEEILKFICKDESAYPQLPSFAAAYAESIREEVGTVSLKEEQEATIEHLFSSAASTTTCLIPIKLTNARFRASVTLQIDINS